MTRALPSVLPGQDGKMRCFWCASDDLYQSYHDGEWGRPQHDERRLFEKLCLEGFQAGLSWLTILKKRENFRRAFSDFDFVKVARFGDPKVRSLLADPGIVRHRGKIEAAIDNAKAALELKSEYGSLDAYFWRFVPERSERPKRITRASLVPITETPTSRQLAKDLRSRGFRFIGPTTAYAFMQAMGLVNDHMDACAFRALP